MSRASRKTAGRGLPWCRARCGAGRALFYDCKTYKIKVRRATVSIVNIIRRKVLVKVLANFHPRTCESI